MSNVRIATDTTAAVPPQLARELGIKVMPAALITYGGHQYLEGVTLSIAEAYEMILKDPDSWETSPLTPANMVSALGDLTKPQDMLLVTISSGLSALNKVAHLMAELQHEKYPQVNIRVFDSLSVGAGEAMVAMAAAKMAKKGMGLDELEKLAALVRGQTKSIMMLDTLRYVYRTGRMTKEQAQQAAEQNLKPINRMSDTGTLEFADMVTEREAGYDKMIKIIQKEAPTDALHFVVNHAAAPDMAKRLCDLLKENFKVLSLLVSEYSPVMGAGAGPGCVMVGYHPEIDILK